MLTSPTRLLAVAASVAGLEGRPVGAWTPMSVALRMFALAAGVAALFIRDSDAAATMAARR